VFWGCQGLTQRLFKGMFADFVQRNKLYWLSPGRHPSEYKVVRLLNTYHVTHWEAIVLQWGLIASKHSYSAVHVDPLFVNEEQHQFHVC
jgi:hypothetical protein